MSSTLVVGTPTPVVSSVSFNTRSPPSAPSPSSGVNTVSLPTLVISPTPFTSLVTSTLLGQSQQPSPAIQSAMSATPVITTTAPSSASLSAPLSPAPLTSTRVPPVLSVTPSTTMTSTPGTSVQPTTTSTTTAPGSTQSPTLMSSPLATTTLRTTSSASMLAFTPTTPFTTTSSPSSSSPLSRGSSAEKTNVPLTTVLEGTTVFITRTNSQGQVMTSIPPVVTEVITTTGIGGIVTTVTQVVVNPTLASNNSTTDNPSFFTNTGGVVGVFVVVGLASASILMWILFAIRHRQRMRRTEQDTAVEAVVAAAGLHRAPLDDDDNDDSPISPTTRHLLSSQMGQRSNLLGLGGSDSLPTSARLLDDTMKDGTNSHPECPVEHRTNSYPKGYVPARTASPSPRTEPCTDDLGSSRDRKSSYGHTPTYSAGSFEPLLANYVQNMPDQDTSAPTMQALQNRPPQHPGSGLDLHGYFGDGSLENKSRTSSKRQNSSDSSVLRDEEDYSRYVLMVRNIPDDQSQHSL